MSKYRSSFSSIYIDGTDIPKNKLDINNSIDIHEAENMLLEQAYIKLSSERNRKTILNETYYISLHKKTFEALYTSAGIYRNVNMSKGESQFCLAQYLDVELKRIFTDLKEDNYLQDIAMDKKAFAKKLAYYQGELIALHPFYELNGRITRLYCDILALSCGYNAIDYSDAIDNGAYIDASIACCVLYADTGLLEKIIFDGLVHGY